MKEVNEVKKYLILTAFIFFLGLTVVILPGNGYAASISLNPTLTPVVAGSSVGGFLPANYDAPASGNYTYTNGNSGGEYSVIAYKILPTSNTICDEAVFTSIRLSTEMIAPSFDDGDIAPWYLLLTSDNPSEPIIDVASRGGSVNLFSGNDVGPTTAGGFRGQGFSTGLGVIDFTASANFTKAEIETFYVYEYMVSYNDPKVITFPTVILTYNDDACPKINNSPIATPDIVITQKGTSVNIDLLGNDSDPDNDPLTITQIDGKPVTVGVPISLSDNSGTITLNADGTITFIPNEGFTGTVNTAYTISDGRGGTHNGTIEITVVNNESTTVVDDQSIPTAPNTGFQQANIIADQFSLVSVVSVVFVMFAALLIYKPTSRMNR